MACKAARLHPTWPAGAAEGRPATESSWSERRAAACRARVPPRRASADAKPSFLPGTRSARRAGQGHRIVLLLLAVSGLVVGTACSSSRTSSLARTTTLGSHAYVSTAVLKEKGRSPCDTYEISRQQRRGLTTPEEASWPRHGHLHR